MKRRKFLASLGLGAVSVPLIGKVSLGEEKKVLAESPLKPKDSIRGMHEDMIISDWPHDKEYVTFHLYDENGKEVIKGWVTKFSFGRDSGPRQLHPSKPQVVSVAERNTFELAAAYQELQTRGITKQPIEMENLSINIYEGNSLLYSAPIYITDSSIIAIEDGPILQMTAIHEKRYTELIEPEV